MPAPRAILSDLHDFTLDPTVKHESIGIDGRLAHVALSNVTPSSAFNVVDDEVEVTTQKSTITEDVETQPVEEEHVSSKEDVEVVTEEVVTKVETEKEVEITENVKAHSNNKKRGDAKKK